MKKKLMIGLVALVLSTYVAFSTAYNYAAWRGVCVIWDEITAQDQYEAEQPESTQRPGFNDPNSLYVDPVGGGANDGIDEFEPLEHLSTNKGKEIVWINDPRRTQPSDPDAIVKTAPQLEATLVKMYDQSWSGDALENDTEYLIKLEGIPKNPDRIPATVHITAFYPKQVWPGQARSITVWVEIGKDEAYRADLTVQSEEKLSLVHGSSNEQSVDTGVFDGDIRDGTLSLELYTGATEEHLLTHNLSSYITGVFGTTYWEFVRMT